MACNNQYLSNIGRDCSPAKGGIRQAWFAVWAKDIFTVSGDTANNPFEVSAISSAATWYHYEFRKGTGSFTSTQSIDEANGLNYVETDVVLRFGRMESDKRYAVAALALGGVAGIVEDNNGSYWAFGVEEEMVPQAGTGQSGTAVADGNYYEITLRDTYSSFPLEIKKEAMENLNVAE